MPAEHRMDPCWFDVVAAELARSSAVALEASDELLAHYGDTGDATAQLAVDALVDEAVGTLTALSECLGDTSRELQGA